MKKRMFFWFGMTADLPLAIGMWFGTCDDSGGAPPATELQKCICPI
jgi:hypothetical protein